jgi:hypothetical protein
MVDAVIVKPATNAIIVTGGTAVQLFPGGLTGGILQNPQAKQDEGIANAEPVYVDPVGIPGSALGSGWGTTFTIYPGGTWLAIPGQSTQTMINAATNGHRVSAVYW